MSNKVSVIMPIYKVEKYLEKSINSVLNQTYTNFELILVDDGSPDNCPKICDVYAEKDDRVKVIHKQNGGLSSARNAGLDIATGKYVYFIDSDNYIESNLLQTAIEHMDNGCDLFCFRHKELSENKEYIPNPPRYFGEYVFPLTQQKLQMLVDFGLNDINYELCNKVFKADIIKINKISFAKDEKKVLYDLTFCLSYLTFCNNIFSSNLFLCSKQQGLYDKNTMLTTNLINKTNESLKTYYEFLRFNKKELLKVFVPLYFVVIEKAICKYLEFNNKEDCHAQEKLVVINSLIEDKNFYCIQLKNLKKFKKNILSLEQFKKVDTKSFFLKLIEVQYLVSGNLFIYKLKRKWFFIFGNKLLKSNNIYISNKLKNFNKNKNKIYFLGTEAHCNIGDLLINVTIIKFLEEKFTNCKIFEVSVKDYFYFKNTLKKYIKKQDLIVCPGGGNFGNEYTGPDNVRMDVVQTWKENKKVIFPQTIYFTKDEEGIACLEASKQIYAQSNNIVIFTREQFSYQLAKEYYYCPTYLVPDIVLYNNFTSTKYRDKILFCLRNDKEGLLSQEKKDEIFSLLQTRLCVIEKYDLQIEEHRDTFTRNAEIDQALNLFSTSKLVITDRLHGMIIAAITGTPCVALSNYNHKIKSTFEWLKHLPYIKFVENLEDIEHNIIELLNVENSIYDNNVLLPYYEKIVKEIKG